MQENSISREEEQETLLKIVETWRPSEEPEFRGFKCANCQEFKNEAWYHWVNTNGYKLPIHMCNDTCEPSFRNRELKIDESKRSAVDRNTFGKKYPEIALKRFREIVSLWPEYKEPQLKAFTCDNCDKDLNMEPAENGDMRRQGFHVWWKMDDGKTLAELHFHRDCGNSLGIE